MSAAEQFDHPLLRAETPAAWVDAACVQRDILLIDHANCEKKAASTALALMFAYAEDLVLTDKLIAQGQTPVGSTPEELTKVLDRETPIWAELIKQSGAKVE